MELHRVAGIDPPRHLGLLAIDRDQSFANHALKSHATEVGVQPRQIVIDTPAVRTLFDGNNNRLGRSLDGFRSDCARRFANGLHRLGVNVIDEVFGHAASIIKEEARQTALPGQ